MMRIKISIDRMSDINELVQICSKLPYDIKLIDGKNYCVSAKSLIGGIATMDWTEVFIECSTDIYSHIQKFAI